MPKYDLDRIKIASSSPSTGANNVAIYSKLYPTTAENELFYRRESDGTEIMITRDGWENNLNIDLSNYVSVGTPSNGDILYYDNGWRLLSAGEEGQVLTMTASGLPIWSDPLISGQGGNLLPNSALWYWRSGTNAAPSFTVLDVSSTIARNNTTTNIANTLGQRADITTVGGLTGSFGWKVGTNGFTDGNYISVNSIKGQQISAGAWVYCTTASRVRLKLYGGTVGTTFYSSYHTGGGWEWLSTLDNDFTGATTLQFTVEATAGASITYGVETPCVGIGAEMNSWTAYTFQGNRTYVYNYTWGTFSTGYNYLSPTIGFHVAYFTGTVSYDYGCALGGSPPGPVAGPTCTSSTGQLSKATISMSSSCSGSYLAINDGWAMDINSWNTTNVTLRQNWGASCYGLVSATLSYTFEERSLS